MKGIQHFINSCACRITLAWLNNLISLKIIPRYRLIRPAFLRQPPFSGNFISCVDIETVKSSNGMDVNILLGRYRLKRERYSWEFYDPEMASFIVHPEGSSPRFETCHVSLGRAFLALGLVSSDFQAERKNKNTEGNGLINVPSRVQSHQRRLFFPMLCYTRMPLFKRRPAYRGLTNVWHVKWKRVWNYSALHIAFGTSVPLKRGRLKKTEVFLSGLHMCSSTTDPFLYCRNFRLHIRGGKKLIYS